MEYNIQEKLDLILNIMDYDEIDIIDIKDTLEYFNNLNILDKVNNESLNLIKQITFGNKCDCFTDSYTILVNKYLRYLLLPFNYNKCDKDYNLKNYLSEFDIFINLIKDNCNMSDYILISKYNKELYEIVIRFKKISQEIEHMNIFIYAGLKEKMVLNGMISHISTLLYLFIDKFDYNYDLLNAISNDILNNFINLLIICDENKIFQNLAPTDENEILREYDYCYKIMMDKYNPPIKIKRRSYE